MFRLYSKGCEHAIRALSQAALGGGKERFTVKEVCRLSGAPELSTRKIFQSLVQRGVLKATPGPGGGYALTRRPERVPVLSLIEAIDGEDAFQQCVMGLPTCSNRRACPLHATWLRVKQRLLSELESTTLQDLSNAVR